MDILFNQFTILTVSLIGLLVVFSTYSIKTIHRHGAIGYLSQLGRIGKAIAGALTKLIAGLIAFFAASADTSDEEENDVSADAYRGGTLNYRTGKLDDGTDPYGWYEND